MNQTVVDAKNGHIVVVVSSRRTPLLLLLDVLKPRFVGLQVIRIP